MMIFMFLLVDDYSFFIVRDDADEFVPDVDIILRRIGKGCFLHQQFILIAFLVAKSFDSIEADAIPTIRAFLLNLHSNNWILPFRVELHVVVNSCFGRHKNRYLFYLVFVVVVAFARDQSEYGYEQCGDD